MDRWSARKRKVKQTAELDTDAVVAGSAINLDSNDASPLAPLSSQDAAKQDAEQPENGSERHELSNADSADAQQDQAQVSIDDSTADQAPLLSDADMPSIETLTAKSDLSDFFNKGVSAGLRRAALRHVFQLPVYNERDGLNDYDDDFTKFEPLGDTVTSDMKWHKERKEREAEEAAAKQREEEEQAQRKLDEADTERAEEQGDEPTVEEQGAEQSTEQSEPSVAEKAEDDYKQGSDSAGDRESEAQPDALESLEKQELETVPAAHAMNRDAQTEGTPS